jgi:hypothetical protein
MGRRVSVWSYRTTGKDLGRERKEKRGSYSRYRGPMSLHLGVWKTLVNRIEQVIRDGMHTGFLAGGAELERWLYVASDRH